MNKQPNALRILIPTEMAETFGYFTLQAILIFYLTETLSFSDEQAYILSGQFIAFAWLAPVIGGWITDRILGYRIAIFSGCLLLCLGYALLSLGRYMLFLGLSVVIIGQGLVKSNIASFVGEFYSQQNDDTRRKAGFILFYVGINIGSLLAIASAGYIRHYFNEGVCFGLASFALLLSASTFWWGFRYFDEKGFPPNGKFKTTILLPILSVVLILVYYGLKNSAFGNYSVYAIGLLFILYISIVYGRLKAPSRQHLLALMILFVIGIFYKAMFFENYLVVNLFTERAIDRTLFGKEIPATVFLSLGSLFTILLGSCFAYTWRSNKLIFSIPVQFALGLFIVGSCMAMLAIWLAVDVNVLLPATSIIVFRFFFSISELLILPLGLSMITEYAPQNYKSVIMGGWYLTAAFGGKLAAWLADYANVPKNNMNVYHVNSIYHLAFQKYALLNGVLFVICLLLTPMLNKLLKKNLSKTA
jgi:proton-dependent oligopeptide transporter, POT family